MGEGLGLLRDLPNEAGKPVYLNQIMSLGEIRGSQRTWRPLLSKLPTQSAEKSVKGHLDIFRGVSEIKQMKCRGFITLKKQQRGSEQRKFTSLCLGKEHQGESCCCLYTMSSQYLSFLAFTKAFQSGREFLPYIAIKKDKTKKMQTKLRLDG